MRGQRNQKFPFKRWTVNGKAQNWPRNMHQSISQRLADNGNQVIDTFAPHRKRAKGYLQMMLEDIEFGEKDREATYSDT